MDENGMKYIISILALLPSLAFADANDILISQRNPTDTGTFQRVLTSPSGGQIGILIYDQPNLLPGYLTLGTGLTASGGVLSVSVASQVNADWNASNGIAQILNKPSIPAAQVNSDWNSSAGVSQILNKPALAAVATSGSYNDLTNKPTRSFGNPARSLNTCFQVSSTRDAFVSYSVDIATSLSLTAGQQGTVYLRTYTNNTCTTGTQEQARFVNGQTGTLTIGLALTQNVTGTLSAMIQGGSWVQIVSENNTGTPTFTMRSTQEVLF